MNILDNKVKMIMLVTIDDGKKERYHMSVPLRQGDESKTEMPPKNAFAPFILTADGTRSCVYRTFQVRKQVNDFDLHILRLKHQYKIYEKLP